MFLWVEHSHIWWIHFIKPFQNHGQNITFRFDSIFFIYTYLLPSLLKQKWTFSREWKNHCILSQFTFFLVLNYTFVLIPELTVAHSMTTTFYLFYIPDIRLECDWKLRNSFELVICSCSSPRDLPKVNPLAGVNLHFS